MVLTDSICKLLVEGFLDFASRTQIASQCEDMNSLVVREECR